jgi:transcriptional regulator GlxA family with amidase domain
MPPHLVRRAKHYIEAHLSRLRDIQQVADELDVSCDRLNERFREVEGMPLDAYIQRCRVTYMKLYLSTTELDNEAVAERVGFEDEDAANRAFHAVTNYRMTQFRDLFRLGEDV